MGCLHSADDTCRSIALIEAPVSLAHIFMPPARCHDSSMLAARACSAFCKGSLLTPPCGDAALRAKMGPAWASMIFTSQGPSI
eukprot:7426364-Pyramimonas_sp.AAC.1